MLNVHHDSMGKYSFLIISVLISWLALILSMRIDKSRYRNVLFLSFAWFSLFLLLDVLLETSLIRRIFLIVIICMILSVPFMLIVNGMVMIRREGNHFANLLSLLFGIFILIGEIATLFIFIIPSYNQNGIARIPFIPGIISISIIYISLIFVSFMFYSLLVAKTPLERNYNYVVILGCGLMHGNQISKLLADRLNKAIEIYRNDPAAPIMIPSGGQGKDETIAEADAMAEYLETKGIPADHVVVENHSKNTYENLLNCRNIINKREGKKNTVIVTSNYHVYRALRYCRRIHFHCAAAGAHVAAYYWPSAIIREFAAVHMEKKHLFFTLAGWLLLIMVFIFMWMNGMI